MASDTRRAPTRFALSDSDGALVQAGEAEAVIGEEAIVIGPVTVRIWTPMP